MKEENFPNPHHPENTIVCYFTSLLHLGLSLHTSAIRWMGSYCLLLRHCVAWELRPL